MSNRGTDDRTQRIVDAVTEVWKLPYRDDLLDDCLDFVEDNFDDYYYSSLDIEIKDLVIEYLSMKCADALSTADLEAMARAEEETKISSYQEADQGVWQWANRKRKN